MYRGVRKGLKSMKGTVTQRKDNLRLEPYPGVDDQIDGLAARDAMFEENEQPRRHSMPLPSLSGRTSSVSVSSTQSEPFLNSHMERAADKKALWESTIPSVEMGVDIRGSLDLSGMPSFMD